MGCLGLLGMGAYGGSSQPSSPIPESPHEGRVEEILGRMSLEEKIGEVVQLPITPMLTNGTLDLAKARHWLLERHVGSFLSIAGEDTQTLQRIAIKEGRLGIPILFGMDAIHGHALYERATVFPMPLALSCSWDPELLERVAEATAKECRATGVRWTFSPVLDVARDPRWGRVVEGFGEDPFLTSVLGATMIRGYQGEDLSQEGCILATAKHFVAYSQTTGGRDYSPADIGLRTLLEVFLPPFEAAVQARVGSVMTAFNEVNGIPMTANVELVRDYLKGSLQFPGLVVSDWASIRMLYDTQFVARTPKEAARQAIAAGVDMDMATDTYLKNLSSLVCEDIIPEAWVDEAAGRILEAKLRLGLFESPYDAIRPDGLNTPEHRALALEAARESLVLLKNKGTLPLREPKRIAVIGPLSDAAQDQLGGWSAPQPKENVVTVLQGIKRNAPPGTDVAYARGALVQAERGVAVMGGVASREMPDQVEQASPEALFDEAISAARHADVIVAVVGETATMSSEPNVRSDLGLPGGQQALLEGLKKLQKPLVAVLINGRPLAVPWVKENADAILEAFFPGEEGGSAIAEVLFGKTNPSGRLTMTFPRAVGQVPIHYNHHPQKNWDHEAFGEGRYIDLDDEPLFWFGEGMGYTRFSYAGLSLQKTPESLVARFELQNTGGLEGADVPQLYVSMHGASVVRPDKELKAFQKVTLAPGEKRTLTFRVPWERLAYYGKAYNKEIEPGTLDVLIGRSANEIVLSGTVTLEEGWEDPNTQATLPPFKPTSPRR
jgi:beta-glucosidase